MGSSFVTRESQAKNRLLRCWGRPSERRQCHQDGNRTAAASMASGSPEPAGPPRLDRSSTENHKNSPAGWLQLAPSQGLDSIHSSTPYGLARDDPALALPCNTRPGEVLEAESRRRGSIRHSKFQSCTGAEYSGVASRN